MASRQYRRSELAILNALLAATGRSSLSFPPDQKLYTLNTSEICRLAEISRSTLYRHHPKAAAILIDLENFLLRAYRRRISAITQKNGASPQVLYLETLLFILRHRPYYQILVALGRTSFLELHVRILLPHITKFYKFSRRPPLFFKVYEKQIALTLEIWILSDFAPSESVLARDLLYFTKTFPSSFRASWHHFPPHLSHGSSGLHPLE